MNHTKNPDWVRLLPGIAALLVVLTHARYADLTHLLTQVALRDALNAHGMGPLAHTWSYIFLSTAPALSVAALSHHYLEQGWATWCRRWLLGAAPARSGGSGEGGSGAEGGEPLSAAMRDRLRAAPWRITPR